MIINCAWICDSSKGLMLLFLLIAKHCICCLKPLSIMALLDVSVQGFNTHSYSACACSMLYLDFHLGIVFLLLYIFSNGVIFPSFLFPFSCLKFSFFLYIDIECINMLFRHNTTFPGLRAWII